MEINQVHMLANTPTPAIGRPGTVFLLALLLTSCVSSHAPPPPVRLAPQPIARATPNSAPAQLSRASGDWRDRDLTPGDWRYVPIQGGSVARYGDGHSLFALTCDTAHRTVTLARALDGTPGTPAPAATLVTTTRPHPLSGTVSDGSILAITLSATDPALDEMAFSRGRFAFEASGQPTLILPAWEEVGRVIEDCR